MQTFGGVEVQFAVSTVGKGVDLNRVPFGVVVDSSVDQVLMELVVHLKLQLLVGSAVRTLDACAFEVT